MALGNHVAEIARQGIWASLTGGWCYEPSNSLFCNTVHLYIWSVLLLFPLLLGLFTAGSTTWVLCAIYLVFVLLLFSLVKFMTIYLHRLFDKTEPMIAMKDKKTATSETFRSPVSSFSTTRRETSNIDGQVVEMVELENKGGENKANNQVELVFEDEQSLASLALSAGSGENSSNALLGISKKDRQGIALPTDSLELIPLPKNNSDLIRQRSFMSGRKMSEPNFGRLIRRSDRALTDPGRKIRRARSSSDTHGEIKRGYDGTLTVSNVHFAHETNLKKNESQSGKNNYSSCEDNEPCCSKYIDNEPSSSKRPEKTKALAIIPSTALHRTLERIGNENLPQLRTDREGDLKMQITKFLEELIDKHPETLDAIENVRMSRLCKQDGVAYKVHEPDSINSSENTSPSALQLGLRQGTHVAYDHEDTTDGAVHSFQDEHGNWWTYAFDEQGSGTAQALGSSTAIAELFDRRREKNYDGNEEKIKRFPKVRHPDDHEFSYKSTGRLSDARPVELTKKKDHRRSLSLGPRDSVLVSSNASYTELENFSVGSSGHKPQEDDSDSDKCILDRPTNVFHPSGTTNAAEYGSRGERINNIDNTNNNNRPFISFVNLASRLYNNQIQRNSPGNRERASIHSSSATQWNVPYNFHPNMSHQSRMALEAFALESRRRLQVDSGERLQWHDYMRLDNELMVLENASNSSRRQSNNFAPPRVRTLRPPPAKLNYYYRLRLFPKWVPFYNPNGVKLKLNRLALTALFDRNRSLSSCVFDIIIGSLVTLMAAIVIHRGIYSDICTLIFAFIVAGAQFSLLKSVQPDAASPIHGFNWLVCYSRAVYFCLFCAIVLLLEWELDHIGSAFASPSRINRVGLQWNPKYASEMTFEAMIVMMRDFVAALILFLPIMFTLGLLPQVNTLVMHVLEQAEMNLFGGTAAFSMCSSIFSVTRSLTAIGILAILGSWINFMEPDSTQNLYFSIFVAIMSSFSYVASRWSNNPLFYQMLWEKCCSCWENGIFCKTAPESVAESRVTYRPKDANSGQSVFLELRTVDEKKNSNAHDFMSGKGMTDPLPDQIRHTLVLRTQHDCFVFILNSCLLFALHSTSVFTAAQPHFQTICCCVCAVIGVLNHYIYHQMRSHTPWKIFARPILRSFEYNQFETTVQAKLMFFERAHVWLQVIEKYLIYPITIISFLTTDKWIFESILLTTLISFRLFRQAYSAPQMLYVPFGATFIITASNFHSNVYENTFFQRFFPQKPPFLLLFYLLAVIWPKIEELLLKLNFIFVYIAPWQISWGSAFHAFAQPFAVPHTGFMAAQAVVSSVISAPLNPVLGSSLFLLSYCRPVRFWEKDYNTKRVDNSNIRLVSQLDRGPMMDDSSLNAIFYEHLTRSLQKSLAGDLAMGRWASSVEAGDCFILVSLYLSCMVHIIEVGNGFVTFQVRGLEFRGTYCHQREAEAISEDWADGGGCCCCTLGSIPGLLSYNNAWALRWLAWEVTSSKYVIDGYSITDNSAVNLLQVHELRRLLVTLYVKCIIYYCTRSKDLSAWMKNTVIIKAMEPIMKSSTYSDNDPMFCSANDEDFDINLMAITKHKFLEKYGAWIKYCFEERKKVVSKRNLDLEQVNSFCFALSILGRRALGAAAYNRHANAAESFLYGLHSLFKGDMRVASVSDEWVLADPEILTTVISPAVRMALKLHQDHFAAVDDYEEYESFYYRILYYQDNIFISHEHDPAWRQAIIANTPSLLALRHMYDESQDDYKVIMLNKMHLNMRVIKLNRECVRAFWSGQQQELIFLRNRNPERGSIQNARQVLRNMINSSADQPIGYPIYVSPLTTSFIETHSQIPEIMGRPITFCSIGSQFMKLFGRLRKHFGTSGSSNITQGTGGNQQIFGQHQGQAYQLTPEFRRRGRNPEKKEDSASQTSQVEGTPSVHMRSRADTINAVINVAQRERERPKSEIKSEFQLKDKAVEIIDISKVSKKLNEPLRSEMYLVNWPNAEFRTKGGKSGWPSDFELRNGLKGVVVHEWHPFHVNPDFRSHKGYIVCLVRILHKNDHLFVPVALNGLKEYRGDRVQTETNL
ncbi:unnamed protein product [Bursaphelenchus xylophilus]|uniref:Pecanex-like protein n=1 Tax=Bursaphelenchus xylophilus TaxID=6326 RepID=A0A1I7RPM6_BURXY|nr:unnamed protein product [Bursaphelenchus xylophilus]CAG9096302.1 unnamed protein product [Bursaphelenchus xylophilus]